MDLALPTAGAAAEDAARAGEVSEVVATAVCRGERLQDAPLAITATSAAKLAELNISDTSQISTVTPGLTFSNSADVLQTTIRGAGARGISCRIARGEAAPASDELQMDAFRREWDCRIAEPQA